MAQAFRDSGTFQSTPSAWRETCAAIMYAHSYLEFQSTPSAWRETVFPKTHTIHVSHFNPLPPHGGRQILPESGLRLPPYFNPLPPHGGRPFCLFHCNSSKFISIHSLRMEGDWPVRAFAPSPVHFNPLPPHGGRQVTVCVHNRRTHFNPLPPHGGRQTCYSVFVPANKFQSTPSAWRETSTFAPLVQIALSFQSTPSAWRETAKLHRKAFFISPILVQSCKKGCKRLHSAPEKMVFFEKREKNLVRNLQHLSVRL